MAQFGTACNVTNVAASRVPAQSFCNCPGSASSSRTTPRRATRPEPDPVHAVATSDGVTTATTRSLLGRAARRATRARARRSARRARSRDRRRRAQSRTRATWTHASRRRASRSGASRAAPVTREPRLAVVPATRRRSRSTEKYRLQFPTMPHRAHVQGRPPDRHHRRRHQHDPGLGAGSTDNVPVTLDTRVSKVTLPIVGGYAQAASAGLTDAETVAPVLGAPPADILVGHRPDRHDGHVREADRHRQRGPEPDRHLRPRLGLEVRRRYDDRDLHRADANGNVSAPKSFNVVVRRDVPVNSPPAAPSRRRCRCRSARRRCSPRSRRASARRTRRRRRPT